MNLTNSDELKEANTRIDYQIRPNVQSDDVQNVIHNLELLARGGVHCALCTVVMH